MSAPLATVSRRMHLPKMTAAISLAALAFGLGLPAHALSPTLQGWLAVNSQCKGGAADDPKTQKACARRDELSARLKRRGCQYQEDGDWWKCPR